MHKKNISFLVPAGKSTYKQKKEAEQRQHSSSSHNWNALFLGLNPIADIMAERLNKTKRDILVFENSKSSTAVRLALGETELVSETRQFLESHGVKLDVFGQVFFLPYVLQSIESSGI